VSLGNFKYHPRRVAGLDQLAIFARNGIRCPEFTINREEARQWVEVGHDVFGRNRNHEKGADIVLQGSAAWDRKEFWSKVIPNVRQEYRIHIFDGEHIQQAVKQFDPKAARKRTDGLPIRNTETGWKYDHDFKPPDAAVDLAKHAVRTLGYLWGAVDLLEDENGNHYILEVNTAPGMDDTTARAYANAIRKYVGKSKSGSLT
jgi:hypothetical protein